MSATAFSIRYARSEDAAALAQLATQLGYPASEADIGKRLRTLLERPTQAVFVACDEEGTVLGCIAAEQRLTLITGTTAEITALIVSPPHRRQGAGRALVLAAELWAHKRGLDQLSVRSNSVREEAHAFYPGLGYQHHKSQHCYLRQLA